MDNPRKDMQSCCACGRKMEEARLIRCESGMACPRCASELNGVEGSPGDLQEPDVPLYRSSPHGWLPTFLVTVFGGWGGLHWLYLRRFRTALRTLCLLASVCLAWKGAGDGGESWGASLWLCVALVVLAVLYWKATVGLAGLGTPGWFAVKISGYLLFAVLAGILFLVGAPFWKGEPSRLVEFVWFATGTAWLVGDWFRDIFSAYRGVLLDGEGRLVG